MFIRRINTDEYAQLLGNFVEVVETHEELLSAIENCNDRVGKLFLSKAATMKCVHQAYCAAHPRAIVILDKHRYVQFTNAINKFLQNLQIFFYSFTAKI